MAGRPKKKRAPMNLDTDRFEKFALAYCGEAEGNATKAAEIAGYSDAAGAGHRLLRRADVRCMIRDQRMEAYQQGVLSRDQLLTWLTGVILDSGQAMKDRVNAAALFAKCTGNLIDRQQLEVISRKGPEERPVIEVDVATGALRQLGKEEVQGDGAE